VKVFLYTPFYPPQSQAAAVRCYWIGRTIKEAGHDVKTVSSISTPETKKMIFNPADNKQGFLKRLVFEFLAGIELFFRILFSRADVYVLSTPPFITICMAHLACRATGKKYILDVRDIYPDVYFAQGLIKESSLVGKLIKSFTKSMYTHARAALSVTPGLVEKIRALAPDATTQLLINGYDKDLFRPSEEKFEKFTVIFHGNMGKIQNLPTILKVAEELVNDEINFVFIGEGPQAELLKGNVSKNVSYLGSKSYLEIPTIISKAHVGFSARRDDEIGADAFPVKVFEYFGVGIPVIMSPRSGVMSRMVESGLYEFGNDQITEMAEKIREIKKSGGTIKLKSEMSRQEVSKTILKFLQP
jgi:glycosyltransferase involved in cell wall biosynthesis